MDQRLYACVWPSTYTCSETSLRSHWKRAASSLSTYPIERSLHHRRISTLCACTSFQHERAWTAYIVPRLYSCHETGALLSKNSIRPGLSRPTARRGDEERDRDPVPEGAMASESMPTGCHSHTRVRSSSMLSLMLGWTAGTSVTQPSLRTLWLRLEG